MAESGLNKNNFSVIGILLHGDLSLDDVTNMFIVTSKTTYMLTTKCFNVLLFNLCGK